MRYWREIVRFLVSLQLLPILESGEETTLVGGQAVIEGVMMRSPHAWGIAVRRPSGEMAIHCEPLQRAGDKHKWMTWPFIRGLVTLGQALKLGYQASRFSTKVAFEEMPVEPGEKKIEFDGKLAMASAIFSVLLFFFLYKFIPLAATTGLRSHWAALNNNIIFNLVDGVIRLGLFLLLIWGLSLFADVRRIFQYHGAEHKTVFAFEDHGMPDVPAAQKYSTYHPRCGTSFLITIMLICIAVYALFPAVTFWGKLAVRLVMLPVIASVAYEMIRFSARHGRSLFALLTRPGLWLQRITTQPPSDEQVQCAIRALHEAMEVEKTHGGELVIA